MRHFILCFFYIIIWSSQALFAQSSIDEKYKIHIKKATEPIKLDGLLDDALWKNAETIKSFYLNRPYDSSYAKLQTEVRIAYDDNNIYVAAVCYQPRNTYTTASLKRDFEGGKSDVFTINLDTFKDKLNGFHFAINPYNVQREGLITEGTDISNFWDNKWYSYIKNYEDRWEAEIAIPFKSIRYKPTEKDNAWRINFGRNVLKRNEVSTWVPVPRNFPPTNLAYTGLLIWELPPPTYRSNIVIIPYISGGFSSDFPRNENTLKPLENTSAFTKGFGLDAKIGVTPSLNLDLTINPDFSQVEVDNQVTNLSRFELFFPERRQFFLENSDLFGIFGFPNSRPFFSRRIGITYNPITGLGQKVPILAGARLSGKLNDNWRIGLMNIQTEKVTFGEDKYLPAANYAVAILQRKLFKRSTLGAFFVNKENFLSGFTNNQKELFLKGYDATASNYVNTPNNRVAGIEFNYNSADNKVESETYYHRSFTGAFNDKAYSLAHFMAYHGKHFDGRLGYQNIGKNFRADVGFIPRKGVQNIFTNAVMILNPKSKKVSKYLTIYGIGTGGEYTYSTEGQLLDKSTSLFVFCESPSGSELFFESAFKYTFLTGDFDPTNASLNPNPDNSKNVVPLAGNTGYDYINYTLGFRSSHRSNISGDFFYTTGGYFNGTSTSIDGKISYRLQPYASFALSGNYTNIVLPKPYNSASYWLLGPKVDITLTRKIFFTSFFQYNTQTNNANINARFQWRFAPVSDIYVVYSDNYFAEGLPRYAIEAFMPKNRALVLKINYWFSL